MCKRCEPWLVGRLIVFTITPRWYTNVTADNDPNDWVEVEGDPRGPYSGRCVRHHKDQLTIKTRANEFHLREEDVIGYYEPKDEPSR